MITKLEIFTAAEKFLTDCFFLQNVCIGITVRMFTVVLFQIFPLLPVQCFLPVVTSITVATDCGEMALYVRGAPPAAASTDTRQPGPGHRPPAQPDNQRDCLQSLLADAADKTGSIRGLSRVNFPKKLLMNSFEDLGPLSGLEMCPGCDRLQDGVLLVLC